MISRLVSLFYVLYLILPIGLILTGSFGETWINTLLPEGHTGQWYAELWDDRSFTRAFVTSLLVAIQALKEEMNMPSGISDTGIAAAEFERRLPEMVGQALRDSCTPTNPRAPDAHALTELYRRAWTGNAVQGH